MSITVAQAGHATVRTSGLGTDVVMVLSDPVQLAPAEVALRSGIERFDLACSRFRPDSEISMLHDSPGTWMCVSDLLFDALVVALDVAEQTQGIVDPTIATCIESLGYDRDFALVPDQGPELHAAPRPAPGWRSICLDHASRRVLVPSGARIDLGATAKALAADRIAREIASLGTGVLLSMGGDISVAGPAPDGGWPIGLAEVSSSPAADADQVVALHSGGLATSSTMSRRWRRGRSVKHHIVDPRTGDSAPAFWKLVTVAADSCVKANALSTAAIVLGSDALQWLARIGAPSRLVRHDGAVLNTPGWPE